MVHLKKLSLIFFAITTLFFISSAQSLTLIAPNGGENLEFGSMFPITWSSSGVSTGKYKLSLWDGETNLGVIKGNINHTANSFSWRVGSLTSGQTISSGSNFKIKIRIQSETPKDFSDRTFSIGTQQPGGTIRVTTPHSTSDFIIGSSRPPHIYWSKTGEQAESVKIHLFDTNRTVNVACIVENTQNDGNFQWSVPTSLSPGEYTVRVQTTDNLVTGFSEIFRIKRKLRTILPDLDQRKDFTDKIKFPANLNLQRLEIVYPEKNALWNLRFPSPDQPFPYAIAWRITRKKDTYVKILLIRRLPAKTMRRTIILANRTLNDGTFDGEISVEQKRSWINGMYSIKIQNLEGTDLAELDYVNILKQ